MKNRILLTLAATACVVCLSSGCGPSKNAAAQKLPTGDQAPYYAIIAGDTISHQDAIGFVTMRVVYPAKFFPELDRARFDPNKLTEVELLWRAASYSAQFLDSLKQSEDWRLKELSFRGGYFGTAILSQTRGFSRDELHGYYQSHAKMFRSPASQPDGKPGDVIPFDSCFQLVAKALFAERNPLDTHQLKAFFLSDTARYPHIVIKDLSPNRLQGYWQQYLEDRYETILMKQFYHELHGKPFTDSAEGFNGEGKLVSPAEQEMVLSWFPSNDQSYLVRESNRAFIRDKIATHKIFVEKMNRLGDPELQQQVESVLAWAWKSEVAHRYLLDTLQQWSVTHSSLDTIGAYLSFWNSTGATDKKPDGKEMTSFYFTQYDRMANLFVTTLLFELQRRFPVSADTAIFRNPYALGSPADLLERAKRMDTNDSVSAWQSRELLEKISGVYFFTPEGVQANLDLAQLLVKMNEPDKACTVLLNLFLTQRDNPENRLVTALRLGTVYAEALRRPKLARKCLEWVASSGRGSAYADSAQAALRRL